MKVEERWKEGGRKVEHAVQQVVGGSSSALKW